MKTLPIIFAFFIVCSMQAQTTAIPDSNFEQALINLGIDSDGTLNGQVLTSDVAGIQQLDVSNGSIYDLTGIQAFSSLKILNISDTQLNQLDLSGNILLEELYCNTGATDVPTLNLNQIDLSSNPNIQIVEARNSDVLESINLQNGNNVNMDQLYLDLYFEGWPGGGNNKQMCIQVDDVDAAQQNQYPYSSWQIQDYQVTYSFSGDCSLGTTEFSTKNIRVFPNPVSDFVFIESHYEIEAVEIFTLNGEKLQNAFSEANRIDVRSLASGIYFIKLSGENGNQAVKKIVKK